MAFERLVGLFVTNDKIYADYRSAMNPILEQYGGGFRYDFKIVDVLKTESEHPINRVFAIYFRDEESANQFFSNPDYIKIKNEFFDKSVNGVTVIAKYNR